MQAILDELTNEFESESIDDDDKYVIANYLLRGPIISQLRQEFMLHQGNQEPADLIIVAQILSFFTDDTKISNKCIDLALQHLIETKKVLASVKILSVQLEQQVGENMILV